MLNKMRAEFFDARVDELDGLTISSDSWWINLRPSNTEPLLRLNVEANTADVTTKLVDQVLDILKKQ